MGWSEVSGVGLIEVGLSRVHGMDGFRVSQFGFASRHSSCMMLDETCFVVSISRKQFISGQFEFDVERVQFMKFQSLEFEIKRCHVSDCRFIFRSSSRSTSGTFTSPNFPGLYPRETECHYLFYGQEGDRVDINFVHFNVEGITPR